jgi:hypothetical protein
MTTGKRFDDERIEAEWQAQERALEQERRGAPGDAGTPRERRYRALARVLAEPPLPGLPPDFAAVVARQARALDAAQEAREQRFERRLMAALWSLLAVAVVGVAVFYGAELVAILRAGPAASPATASWLCVLLGAIGMSCVWQRLQARHTR